MLIRDAGPDDVAAIAAIYDVEVLTATSTFDLVPPPLSAWADKLADHRPGCHVLVATVDDGEGERVLGYACATPYRPRPAYDLTREVSVYLAGDARGRGAGTALYGVLLDRLEADGVHTVLAVVALPNEASEALHLAHGFDRAGTLPQVGFKLDRWIDTAIFARVL